MAAVGPAVPDANMTAMSGCHEPTGADSAGPDCAKVCEHLTVHPDFAKKASSVDVAPLLLAFLQPFELPELAKAA